MNLWLRSCQPDDVPAIRRNEYSQPCRENGIPRMGTENQDMRTPLLLVKGLLLLSIVALVLSVGGYITSLIHKPAPVAAPAWNSPPSAPAAPATPSVDDLRAYGEVPIPCSQTLHLPAGQVVVSFHAVTAGDLEGSLAIPDIKLALDPPPGVAKPTATESIGGTTSIDNDAWRPIALAQIPQEGDYLVTVEGQVTAFVSAHLAFGHPIVSQPPGSVSPPSPSGSAGSPHPANPSSSLSRISIYAFVAALLTLIGSVLAINKLAGGVGQFESAAELLASGQRVPGILKSFSNTGRTPRSIGKTPSRPEFLDDPLFLFDVELQLPDRSPVRGRSLQRVPRADVPNLAVGRQLMCVVDPAKPARRFVVDWGDIPAGSAAAKSSEDVAVAAASAATAATAATPAVGTIAQRLQELETLRGAGVISDAEYAEKRQQIIADI
jgi:hypothetical protein